MATSFFFSLYFSKHDQSSPTTSFTKLQHTLPPFLLLFILWHINRGSIARPALADEPKSHVLVSNVPCSPCVCDFYSHSKRNFLEKEVCTFLFEIFTIFTPWSHLIRCRSDCQLLVYMLRLFICNDQSW